MGRLISRGTLLIASSVIFAIANYGGDCPPGADCGSLSSGVSKSETISSYKEIKVELKGKKWNMVSIPGYSSYRTYELFKEQDIYNVFWFDYSSNSYKQYKPSTNIDTLYTVSPNQGLWVYPNRDTTIYFNVSSGSSSGSTTTTSSSSSGSTGAPPSPPM